MGEIAPSFVRQGEHVPVQAPVEAELLARLVGGVVRCLSAATFEVPGHGVAVDGVPPVRPDTRLVIVGMWWRTGRGRRRRLHRPSSPESRRQVVAPAALRSSRVVFTVYVPSTGVDYARGRSIGGRRCALGRAVDRWVDRHGPRTAVGSDRGSPRSQRPPEATGRPVGTRCGAHRPGPDWPVSKAMRPRRHSEPTSSDSWVWSLAVLTSIVACAASRRNARFCSLSAAMAAPLPYSTRGRGRGVTLTVTDRATPSYSFPATLDRLLFEPVEGRHGRAAEERCVGSGTERLQRPREDSSGRDRDRRALVVGDVQSGRG